MEFTFMIPTDYIVSTNYMLSYRGKSNAPRLSDEARKEKRDIANYLHKVYDENMLKVLEDKKLSITIFYFLKKSFGRRDLDNLEKLSIDGFFKFFKLDDNQIINKTTAKRKVMGSDKEYIYIKLSEAPEDRRLEYYLDDIRTLQGVPVKEPIAEVNNGT